MSLVFFPFSAFLFLFFRRPSDKNVEQGVL